MKRWLVVLTLVCAMLLSGVTVAAAKKGQTKPSGPIYPGGIFYMD